MLTGILQNEWGFHGYAVTDILDDTDLYACMVHAGATGYDLRYKYPSDDTSQFGISGFTDAQSNGVTLSDKMFANDATMQSILKTSVKRTLWTFAQSNLMNRYSATTHTEWQMTSWRAAYISVIVVSAVLVAGCAALYVVSTIKHKKEEE
jgi:beta-glucosidase-like glycosyl hydrolase